MAKRILLFFSYLASILFLSEALLAQVPVITYSPSTNVYTTGTAITALNPTTSGGGAITGGYSSVSFFATPPNKPRAITTDAAGNSYVIYEGATSIYKITPAGVVTTMTLPTNPLNTPTGIGLDGNGNLFVCDYYNGKIYKFTVSGNTATLVASIGTNAVGNIYEPYGITFDSSNNLYIADAQNPGATSGIVFKINASSLAVSQYATGFNNPYGVTIDPTGNLYVSSYTSSNTIIKVTPGLVKSNITGGFNAPASLTSDASGNIYVADSGSGSIKEISAAGVISTLITGLSTPLQVSFDGLSPKNLYEADYGSTKVNKSTATTYYTISAALPAGLSFSTTTGQISGTPTTASASTNYTITAYNSSGTGSTVVNITVMAAPSSYGTYAFADPITLNTTSLGITANLTNFPALLSIQDNNLIISGTCADKVVYPNGPNYDFAFYDSATSAELNYQVESYNQSTGTLLVWVQIPTLTYASNKTITFYYGSNTPSITHNTAFYQATWASDYKAVYHFNESVYSGSVTDGTNGGHSGTANNMTSGNLVSGKIGTAYSFNGSNTSISSNAVTLTGPFTISAWVKLSAINVDQKIITNQGAGGGGTGGYKLGVFSNNYPETESASSGDRGSTPLPTAFTTGTWHYVIGVYSGTTLSTYVDGAQYEVLNTTTNPSSSNPLLIGVGEGGSTYYFNGIIDEPRVSNIAKNANWIKAEYVNQNNPVNFTTVGSTSTNTTNAAAIPGALTYTWTGTSSTDPTVASNWNNTSAGTTGNLPAFDGSATLIIPAGLTNYPVFTANAAAYGLTVANGAYINLNGFTLSVGCNIYNSTGGQILYGGNNASGITWNGSAATQTYNGNNTPNTAQLGNMTVNNSSGGTITINGGPVDVYNTLTITKGNLVVNASPAALTLKSTAALSASVAAIPSSYAITGTVNVERYLVGGAGHRGYRLLSSPVSNGTANSNKVFSINYLINNVVLTGSTGTTGGFDKSGNATLYLFREDLVPSNASFTGGNFWGISKINNTNLYDYYLNGGSTVYNLPVGSGYLLFFRGNRTSASLATETTPGYVPVGVAVMASGTLTQGQVIVHDWYTPTSAYLNYSGIGTGTNSAVRGFNMVGNPYASSIDWEQYNNSSTTTGIYTTANVSNTVYELNPLTYNYDTYQKGGIATNNGTKTIASGQGFFVLATNGTNPQLIFNESAKTSNQNTGNTLFMSTKAEIAKNNNTAPDHHLRIQLSKDSINTDDIYIGFSQQVSANYVFNEDALYKPGTGAVSLSSISEDKQLLAINKEPFPMKSVTIPLNVGASATGQYTLKRTELQAISPLFEIWLMDAYKKDSLDMRANNVYVFNINLADTNSYGSGRFSLVIRQNPALGVHLLSFKGAKITTGSQLSWITENEANYTSFSVERSIDNGKTFITIGGFESNTLGSYNFTDTNPALPIDQYRLKLTDLNGVVTYSSVVTLMYANTGNNLANNAGTISIYPNPAKSILNLQVMQPLNSSPYISQNVNTVSSSSPGASSTAVYGIKIVNSLGSVIKSTINTGLNWQTDVSALTPGTYVIRVVDNSSNKLVGEGTFVKL